MKHFWLGFGTGLLFILSVVIIFPPIPAPVKAEVKYDQLEKNIDKTTCEAMMIQAIISERIRLTGKPNP